MRLANIKAWLTGGVYTQIAYVLDPAAGTTAALEPGVVTYNRHHRPRRAIARQLFGGGRLWRLHVLRRRLRRGQAIAFCLEEGDLLRAFGWVQDWDHYRKRYGWISNEGVMLGPYWTHPDWRGRGVYGRLIAHSLSVAADRGPHLIFAHTNNPASHRGIEKAGFAPLCTFEHRVGPMRLRSKYRVLESHRSLPATPD